jgi:hypothetical protein
LAGFLKQFADFERKIINLSWEENFVENPNLEQRTRNFIKCDYLERKCAQNQDLNDYCLFCFETMVQSKFFPDFCGHDCVFVNCVFFKGFDSKFLLQAEAANLAAGLGQVLAEDQALEVRQEEVVDLAAEELLEPMAG